MQNILIEQKKHRFDIILNRVEKYNALNFTLLQEIKDTLQDLAVNKQCRILVLRSNSSKAFCAGADLETLTHFKSTEQARDYALLLDAVMLAFLRFPKPIIAAIDGLAFGGGFALTAAADLRLGTERCKISFPATRIGAVLPPAVTYMLNALTGIGVSRDLQITGRVVKGKEALKLQLINRLVSAQELEICVEESVEQILRGSDLALEMTRRITNQQLIVDIEQFNLTAAEHFAYLATTKEWKKRISSFFEA